MNNEKQPTNNSSTFEKLTQNIEDELTYDMERNKFIKIVEEYDVVIEDILNKPCHTNDDNIEKFNHMLYKCNKEHGLSIYKCVLFIEERYIEFDKIISLLSGDVKQMLVEEMASKYKIPLKKSKLKSLIKKL